MTYLVVEIEEKELDSRFTTVKITCSDPLLQHKVMNFLSVVFKAPFDEELKRTVEKSFLNGYVTYIDVKTEAEAQFIKLKLEDISQKFSEENNQYFNEFFAFKADERSEEIKKMEQKIKGYRQLDESELALINEMNEIKSEVLRSIQKLEKHNSTDKVWVEAGKIDIEKAFMCLNRSIARPTSA